MHRIKTESYSKIMNKMKFDNKTIKNEIKTNKKNKRLLLYIAQFPVIFSFQLKHLVDSGLILW